MMSLPDHVGQESQSQVLAQLAPGQPARSRSTLEETLEPEFAPNPTESVQTPSYFGPSVLALLTFLFLLFLLWGRRFREMRIGVLSTALVWLCLVIWLVVDAVTAHLLQTSVSVLPELSSDERPPELIQPSLSTPTPTLSPELETSPAFETTRVVAQGLLGLLPQIALVNFPTKWRTFFDLELTELEPDDLDAGEQNVDGQDTGRFTSGEATNAAGRRGSGAIASSRPTATIPTVQEFGNIPGGQLSGNQRAGNPGAIAPQTSTTQVPATQTPTPQTSITPRSIPSTASSNATQNLAETRSQTNSTRRPNQPPRVTSQQPILRRGARSLNVFKLQKLLRTLGLYQGEPDGHFGLQTVLAVQAFQREQNLLVDGIVGFSTCTLLNAQESDITLHCSP